MLVMYMESIERYYYKGNKMKLSQPPNKKFRDDIKVFENKLLNNERFTFSKYADGEWAVIQNQNINNGEFWFNGNSVLDHVKRSKLIESFRYNHPQYYVGVSCPCCQGLDTHNAMINSCEQDPSHITWANLWVNGNYPYFLQNILPIFSDRNVVLFCNKTSKLENLPFKPMDTFLVEHNAWAYNWSFIEEAKQFIKNDSISDAIFLFCCGPFGNILAYELTACCPQNTYLDIGSTLNPFLQSEGFVRDYYVQGSYFSSMECGWNNEK